MFFGTINDYYDFLNLIYNLDAVINGNTINKNFKIYNLCEYNFFKFCKVFRKNSLFSDYVYLKVNQMSEKEKNGISNFSEFLTDYINLHLDIGDLVIKNDINNFIYDFISLNDIENDNLSIQDMLNYILKNSTLHYIVICDSSFISLNSMKNLIVFDINKNKYLEEYNLISYSTIIKNINIEVVVDSIYEFWPLFTERKILYERINYNFLNIFYRKEVNSTDDFLVVLTKFINYFYNRDIKIVYNGNNDTVKSFLSSDLNY